MIEKEKVEYLMKTMRFSNKEAKNAARFSDILPGINAWASKSRYSCMENRLKRRGFKPITKRVKKGE